jgi:hypothetical protein
LENRIDGFDECGAAELPRRKDFNQPQAPVSAVPISVAVAQPGIHSLVLLHDLENFRQQ